MEHLQNFSKNPMYDSVMIDQEGFEGLMPKAIDKLGGIGVPEEQVVPPVLDPRSVTPMEVIDVYGLATEE